MKKIYLATPYSHPDESVRLARFEAVNKKAGELMLKGYLGFSPISHSRPVAQTMDEKMVLDHEFWMKQDMPFLEWADELWIMEVDGWPMSHGVMREIYEARVLSKPVKWVGSGE